MCSSSPRPTRDDTKLHLGSEPGTKRRRERGCDAPRERDVLGNNGERPDREKGKGVVRAYVYLQAEFETMAPRIPKTDKWETVFFSQNSYEHMKEFEALLKRSSESKQ